MIVLRQFKASDLEAVLYVYNEAICTTGAKYYDQDQINAWAAIDESSKQNWLHSLSSNITFVAESDGEIVGFGDMTHSGYIDHVFILQKYQGRGILQRLVKNFEAEAVRLGLKEITTEASLVAMPLAKRLGYQVVTEQLVEHRGEKFINYLMRKKLN